jgi:hypothetical protein
VNFNNPIHAVSNGYAGLGYYSPPESELPEVSVMLPWTIFDGDFNGFIKELQRFRWILSVLGEHTQGHADNLQIVELSTSKPTITLRTSLIVAVAFGKIISWGLKQWKEIESIRLLRAQIEQTLGANDQIVRDLETRMKELVERSVHEKVSELAGSSKVPAERRQEHEIALRDCIFDILKKLTSGVRIEIKAIERTTDASVSEHDHYVEIQNFSRLKFPSATSNSLLALFDGANPQNEDPHGER